MVYYDGQVLANQMAYAAIGNWVIRKIKASSLVPFINNSTYALNHALTIAIAGISALGINYSYSYTPVAADGATGVFVLTLTGLTLSGIGQSAWQWFVSYVFQQTAYQFTKEKNTP